MHGKMYDKKLMVNSTVWTETEATEVNEIEEQNKFDSIPITLPAVNAVSLMMVCITMSNILTYSLLATIIYKIRNTAYSHLPTKQK